MQSPERKAPEPKASRDGLDPAMNLQIGKRGEAVVAPEWPNAHS